VPLNEMIQRLVREVPEVESSYAKTLINEALGLLYDSQQWSFQYKEDGFLTPGLQFPLGPGNSTGTVTVTPFSPQVIGDAVATAAWAGYVAPPFFTSFQFRSPFYSLYNIIALDFTTNAPFGTITLDRPWMEPGGTKMAYMIYQAYFPVPVSDFKRFLAVRDTTNNAPIDYWSKKQRDLAAQDPERTVFDDPGYFVPYKIDDRPNSSTLGNMMYELWPHPLSQLPYSFAYFRRGPALVKPTDTVPVPFTEELALWRAKECAYIYKEAQKGEEVQRGSGADWRWLAEMAHEQVKECLKPIKDRDRDLSDLYWNKFRRELIAEGEPFATVNGQLNVGTME
jgi:hypothetical protein